MVLWSLPAVLLLEDVEVHPSPPVLVCLSEDLRDGLVNTGQDLRVARGHTLPPLLRQEHYTGQVRSGHNLNKT